MSDFKPGDKALLPVEVEWMAGTSAGVLIWAGDRATVVTVPSEHLHPAPEPPYVDPELVPGMVVAPLDPKIPGSWWVTERYDDTLVFVGTPAANTYFRRALPERIRVVFDPREVTS